MTRIPDGYVFSMRGLKKSQPQVREIDLHTHRLVLIKTGENPLEQERLEFHLELMDASTKEEGGYRKPLVPPEGSTHFEHLGYLVFDENLVWSYVHLDAPEVPRGSFTSIGQAIHALVNALSRGHDLPVYSEEAERKRDKVHDVLYEQAHASFGTVRLSRSGVYGDGSLFGSKVRHNHSMHLQINRAVSRRDMSRDWISESSPLIEIEMSSAQFTEMLTDQMTATGVPCTIRRVMGKGMPATPPLPGIRQILQDDVRDMADKVAEHLDALEAQIQEGTAKIGKRRAEALLMELSRVREKMTHSLPHLHKQFIKSCEKTIQDARATIDASFGNLTRGVTEQLLQGKKTIEVPQMEIPQILDFEPPKSLPEGEDEE